MSFQYKSANETSEVRCNLECRRCIALNKTSKSRCSKTTCKSLPYCSVHLKTVLFLQIRKSTISNAGFGLFTLINRNEHDILANYEGRILTKSQLNGMYGNSTNDFGPYVVEISKDSFLDSACVRSIASFANAKHGYENAILVVDKVHKRVHIEAIKFIAAGDEIFLDYGQTYFPKENHLPKPHFSTSSRRIKSNQETSEFPVIYQRHLEEEDYEENDREEHTEWSKSKLAVRKSTNPDAGNGLFAKSKIKAGDTITCIENPIISSEEEAERKGFPHDSVISTTYKPAKGRKKTVTIFDANWTSRTKQPLWYYMNHGVMEANAEMKQTMIGGSPSICWIARRNIEPGDEIFFNYDKNRKLIFSKP